MKTTKSSGLSHWSFHGKQGDDTKKYQKCQSYTKINFEVQINQNFKITLSSHEISVKSMEHI